MEPPFYDLFRLQFDNIKSELIKWDYHREIINSIKLPEFDEVNIIPQAKIIAAICFRLMSSEAFAFMEKQSYYINSKAEEEYKFIIIRDNIRSLRQMLEHEADKLVRVNEVASIELFETFYIKVRKLMEEHLSKNNSKH